jgi:septum formation inhibitor MinC
MAYTSMEGAIILKGTRHGLLASVREDADWREVLRELSGLTTQHANFLKDAQLVLDFGWRETTEEQFDSVISVLKAQGLGCNGILSTSLNTRTIAESRGYRAIIGRLGLAQHQGRRLRRGAEETVAHSPPVIAPNKSGEAVKFNSVEISPSVEQPSPLSASAMTAAASALAKPTIASGLIISPVPATEQASSPASASEPAAKEPGEATEEVGEAQPLSDEVTAPLESAETLPEGASLEAVPLAGDSVFDSTDPAIASLPAVYDSTELEVPRSSSEPGIHVPHFQDEEPTLYIRKTLRSGQRVVFAGNVVLLGDLNPGAQIEADGDVIVLGQLRGSVHAGCEGDEQATVITSSLRATQLRIADRFYKADSSGRFFKKTPPTGTLRARLDGNNVVVEALPAR